MKSALIYLRVSTDRQAERGLSIPAQREACFGYAQRHDFEVVGEYVDEGESARSADRPQLQEMLTRCKKDPGIDAVIVHKIDRFARNTHDHAIIKHILKQNDIILQSVTENIDGSPEGEVMEGMMAVLAQYYSRNLGRETLKGMNQRAQNGLWNAPAPLGYVNRQIREVGGQIRKWVEPASEEVLMVKTAFELYATGEYTLHSLTDALWERGLRTRRGNRVCTSVLARMLRRKFYIGRVEWNGLESDGVHDAIIERQTFDKVQNVLYSRGGYVERQKKHIFILRGIASCGECGARITGEKHTTKAGNLVEYYRCSKRIGRNPTLCRQEYVPVKTLESQFTKLIKAIELRPASAAKLREKIKETAAQQTNQENELIETSKRKIEQCRIKEARLLEKLAEGVIADDDYAQAKSVIEKEKADYERRLSKATEGSTQNAKVMKTALALATQCGKAYSMADATEKKFYAATFFKQILVRDGLIVDAQLNAPMEWLLLKRLRSRLPRQDVNQPIKSQLTPEIPPFMKRGVANV